MSGPIFSIAPSGHIQLPELTKLLATANNEQEKGTTRQ